MDWSTLHWPGGVPLWLVTLIGLVLAESLRRRFPVLRGRLSRSRAGILLGFRALLYLLVLFFLTGPTLLERRERALPPRLMVLVDSSASMGVKDGPVGRSRLEAAKNVLLGTGAGQKAEEGQVVVEEGLLARLSQHYQVQLKRFDVGSTTLTDDELLRLVPQGRGSDAIRAIRNVMEGEVNRPRSAGEAPRSFVPPSGVILISDGGDTMSRTWPPGDVRKFPPVVSLAFGVPRSFRDISLYDVRAPRIAFLGKEVRLEVTLSVQGFIGQKLPVALTKDGRVVHTRTLDVRQDPTRRSVEFRFTPTEVGSLLLAVQTPVQGGELVGSNNRVEIPLEVRRDKIRVLTITGVPAWNYRFLRVALKRDPVIDLVSFVFLRTADDDPGVPTRELSLVPFPLDKLFLEELKNFEIVVFDNFSAQEYFSNFYLERVNDYVRGGGAFLIFGGRHSFAAGGYSNTPLKDLLPVRLAPANDYETGRRLRARLTDSGMRHPITRLASDPKANARLWESFPALRRANFTELEAEGQTLVASEGMPLLATRRFGEGRVVAVLTDDLWRWNFGMVGAGKNNQLYLQLIAQTIRWLAGDPRSSQIQILGDAVAGEGGFSVVRIRVRDEAYLEAKGATVQVTLRDPYGNVQRISAVHRPETGEFEARFIPSGAGSYRVEASARMGEKHIGDSVRTVSVGGIGGAEMADVSPRWARLESIAKASGGFFIPGDGAREESLGMLAEHVMDALKGRVPPRLIEVRDMRLWSIPWFGIWLILLPATEWTLRRLWGLA